MTHKEASIQTIAKNTLQLETLETRNSDSLDFHDMSVWEIHEALKQAYEAGLAQGRKTSK